MPVLLQTTLLLICSMKQPPRLNYLWAAPCICAAVYFVFRES